MLLDSLNAEMAAQSPSDRFYARVIVRTDENLVLSNSYNPNTTEYIDLTKNMFWLMYRPRNDRPKYQGKPYVLRVPDYISVRNRYADWNDFCSECEREPQLMWIKNWSDLDKDFFAMAKRNIGLQLTISFKLKEYEKHLQELYREQFGEDPGDKALLCAPYEGEASAAADEELKDQLYSDMKKRITVSQRERRRKNR